MSPKRIALVLALLLAGPLLAGCLGDDAPATVQPAQAAAPSAEEAGAKTGAAPSAPKAAFEAEEDGGERVTLHPVPIETNAARAPVTLDLSGSFKPEDCRNLNFGTFEETLREASYHRRGTDLAETLRVGDAFSYTIALHYNNTDAQWAEIHLSFGLGSTVVEHEEPTQEMREPISLVWEGQGYRASEDDLAWLEVRCDYGGHTAPIPYTLTATFTFAEGAVPAETPVLLPVPEDATRMFVRGVAVDAGQGVLSHFRLFGPDDRLVCECALSSDDEFATVELTDVGDHVLLVDHTANGFVSVAFDVPPEDAMRPLAAEWTLVPVYTADGGPVDDVVTLTFERVPLFMDALVIANDQGAGGGRGTSVSITNARGEPLHVAWGGHVTAPVPPQMGRGHAWLGMGLGAPWAHETDHHAFSEGEHTVHVQSDALRGTVWLALRQYVRA